MTEYDSNTNSVSPEDVEILSSVDDSSDDTDEFDALYNVAWSTGLNSMTSFNLVPKDGDYSDYKKQIRRDFRVGSAYHIGSHKRNSKRPIVSIINSTSLEPKVHDSPAFVRHPFNLVFAREQGDLGPSSKAKRLRYQASRWRVQGLPRIDGLKLYGARSIGALHTDPQTFPESVQGSLWAVSRLHLENKFKCHRGCVNALCFNYPGNLIASGSDDLKVVITNWITKEQVAKYNSGHCMNIFHVKFLPESNDTKIVSCACDSEVRLAELATDGSLVGSTRLLVSHDRSCHKLALPAGEPNIVLSAGADGQVFSIDVRVPKAENILWLPLSELFSISSNPVNPNELALCGRSESVVRIYDRRKMDGRDPRSGYMHSFGAEHLRGTSRPHQLVLSEASDTERPGHADEDSDTEMDGDSNSFLNSLSAQLGRRVRAVLSGIRGRAEVALRFADSRQESATPQPPFNMDSSKYSVTAAMYSNQGDALMASYNDEDIYLFDVRHPSSPYLHKYSGHRNMQTIVSATFFGPNSEYIVSGSDDGFFYIWDRESEGIVQWLHADADGAVNVIESHPTLPVLASAGLDFDFKVWSPLRPIFDNEEDQDAYGRHLKYTFSRIAPDIRRLRRSQLAKTLFSDTPPHSIVAEPLNSTPTTTDTSPSTPDNNSIPSTMDTVSSSTFPTTPQIPLPMSVDDSSNSRLPPQSNSTVIRKRRRRSSSPVCDSPEGASTRGEKMSVQSDSEGRSSRTSGRQYSKHRKRHTCAVEKNGHDCDTTALLPNSHSNSITGDRVATYPRGEDSDSTDESCALPVPQRLLPFNRKDLELRVAQNWINRACERTQLEGLEEPDPRILSAIESTRQIRARIGLRRSAGARPTASDEDDDDDDDDPSGSDSGILGSFLLVRRPRCPVERSEETLATRDRSDETMHSESSNSDTSENTSSLHGMPETGSSETTPATIVDSPVRRRMLVYPPFPAGSSSSSSSSCSSSPSTAVCVSSSPTMSSQSNDTELLEMLDRESEFSLDARSSQSRIPLSDEDPDDVD